MSSDASASRLYELLRRSCIDTSLTFHSPKTVYMKVHFNFIESDSNKKLIRLLLELLAELDSYQQRKGYYNQEVSFEITTIRQEIELLIDRLISDR